jgi:hypothetical protein
MAEEDFVDGELVEIVGELTEDKLSTIKWKTKEGNIVLVKDMDDKHLRNCALFLMGFGYDKCVASEPVRVMWLRVLNMEWKRRMTRKQFGNRKWLVQ